MSQGTKRVTEAEDCEPGRAEGEGAMKGQRCRVWWALTLYVGNRWRIAGREVM